MSATELPTVEGLIWWERCGEVRRGGEAKDEGKGEAKDEGKGEAKDEGRGKGRKEGRGKV
eukprot:280724-Chlamydomonas_euryale.AAC.1